MAKLTHLKVRRVVGECFVYVEGMAINCPLCGAIVRSGEQHTCKELEDEAQHQARLRAQVAPKRRRRRV